MLRNGISPPKSNSLHKIFVISSKKRIEGVIDVTDETIFLLVCFVFSLAALVWIFVKYR